MEKSLMDILIELNERKEKYFKNYMHYVKKIKGICEKFLGDDFELILFGSILRKGEIPEDIDILVVSDKAKSNKVKIDILTNVDKNFGLIHPFEIHFATRDEFENWYKHFIDRYLKV